MFPRVDYICARFIPSGIGEEVLLDLLGLRYHLLRQIEELLIAVLHVLGRLFATPPGGVDQLFGNAPN